MDAVEIPTPAVEPSTFTPLDVRALRINARPLICADCRSDRLISRFSVLPFVDLITAGGCGPADGTDAAAIGTIPRALRAFREVTGSWTGTAVLLAEAGCACACCTCAEAAEVGVIVVALTGGEYAGVVGLEVVAP